MVDGPTIGVLTMSIGCDYFGGVLGGIAQAAAAVGGRMIAIQTLGAGTFDEDPPEPPDFAHPVAWDHVSAFVVILNSASVRYLEAVRAAGKPVVMISDELPGFRCPVVLPDNRSGVREAVRHLVAHGHRDIAFAGYLELRDLSERFTAYRQALVECGITPRDDLYFDTGDNRESGGERAARAMIAAGLPGTAVVAGNDLNAIGLIRELTARGYRVPADQAVVGFDDMDGVIHMTPNLSSVRQRFETLGRVATELVLRELAGEPVAATSHTVPTEFVARQSCGCPDPLALGAPATTHGDGHGDGHSPSDGHGHGDGDGDGDGATIAIDGIGVDSVTDGLVAIPLAGRGGRCDPAAMRRHAATLVAALDAAAGTGPAPSPSVLGVAVAGVNAQNGHPEDLVTTMRYLREVGHRRADLLAAGDPAAAGRVRAAADELTVALAHDRCRTQFRYGEDFLTSLKMLYTVSKQLLSSHQTDPRGLDWLRDTHATAGCLGLWPADGPRGTLEIAATFDRTRGMATTARPVPVSAFPPADLVRQADLRADQMVYVAPLHAGPNDWGMLALVGPIQAEVATGREMMNQWAALLTTALDHAAVLKSLRQQEELLRHAALYDPLTGLANRALFTARLTGEIAAHAGRQHPRYAVLLLDLDGFKLVNDSLGHLAGDRLLVQVADRIQAAARGAEVTARFGGDEFAILLTDVPDPTLAAAVADRIRAALAVPFRLGDEEVVISSSIGIALGGNGYHEAEEVVRDADTAMYSAKWQRKGAHAIFDIAMHDRAVGRLRTGTELHRALEGGEFELHYQPIVCLDDTEVTAFEALLRWRHPSRGLLVPKEFLLVAEENGLMPPIGRWVLREACRQLSRWRTSGAGPVDLRMSVNVSNRQFWHTRLFEDVEDSVRAAALDPSALIIEVTEGVIVNDVHTARRKLAELHELGVQVHIDDFGTGYSSLEALHHLTIDAFKIDRSFVAPLDTDPRSRELVRTIVAMGANLGLHLVAEGIETTAQRDHLRRAGCRHGQGYLFARPLPATAAEGYLAAPNRTGSHPAGTR